VPAAEQIIFHPKDLANNSLISPILRGFVFLMTLTIMLKFNLRFSMSSLRKLLIFSGTLISSISLLRLIHLYFFSPAIASSNYTSSLIIDYNYFTIPILLGVISILATPPAQFKKTHGLLLIIMSMAVYLSFSRRAFLILNLALAGSLLLNIKSNLKRSAFISLILLLATPLVNPNFMQATYKSIFASMGGKPDIWNQYSGIYYYRYIRIFGENVSIDKIRNDRTQISYVNLKLDFNFNPFRVIPTILPPTITPDLESQSYDSGGRIERWIFAGHLFKNYDLTKKLIGNGFSYLTLFKEKFFPQGTADYPHLLGASVLLYSGLIGLFFFSCLLFQSFRQLIQERRYYMLSLSITVLAMIVASMNTPFDSYVQLMIFALPLFVGES